MKSMVVIAVSLLSLSAGSCWLAAEESTGELGPDSALPRLAVETDLAVTDIFLDRLRDGHLWVRITDHGPQPVHGPGELIVVVDGGGLLAGCQLSVVPGQTQTLNTGIVVDASGRTRDITVTVRARGVRDLRPANNTYRERVP
jgi:hypothetical protein